MKMKYMYPYCCFVSKITILYCIYTIEQEITTRQEQQRLSKFCLFVYHCCWKEFEDSKRETKKSLNQKTERPWPTKETKDKHSEQILEQSLSSSYLRNIFGLIELLTENLLFFYDPKRRLEDSLNHGCERYIPIKHLLVKIIFFLKYFYVVLRNQRDDNTVVIQSFNSQILQNKTCVVRKLIEQYKTPSFMIY